jgi:pilin isopeptide linkage protein
VSAPATNEYTSKNVVVTDEILCDSNYLETDRKKIYQNYTASTGENTFDPTTGVWTIGDMTPGQVETLTYNLVFTDSAVKSGALSVVQNRATVTFNDDGTNQASTTLNLPNTILQKTIATTSDGILYTVENGETYVTYTLTVTANNGDEKDLTVVDEFGNPSLIKRIEGQPSVGTVTYDNDKASFEWKIDSLSKGEIATLTYYAYLNDDAWQAASSSGTVSQDLENTASLYIGGQLAEVPTIADMDGLSTKVEKTWVKKESEQVSSGRLKYTVAVNSEPLSDNIVSVYDILTAGGTYESGGKLVINRYTSSDKTQLVDSTEILLSEIVTTEGSGYRWDVDLVARGLNGAYYYEFVYYVTSSALEVSNNAGIGFGVGPGYSVKTQVQGGGGMVYDTDYSKSVIGDSAKKDYKTSWKVTVKKTIPQGAVYMDWGSAEYVYKHEQFWFDQECLDDIVITFNNQTLVQGVDYTVVGVRSDNTGYADITDPYGKRFSKFEITFNNEYEASSANPLVITYSWRCNSTPHSQENTYPDGCMRLSYNYCNWKLPEYGELVEQKTGGANYQRGYYSWDTPLQKKIDSYNEDTGIVTWKLIVNTNTTIDGDATIIEYLPYGLTYVDAYISERPFEKLTAGTTLGAITQEEYLDSSGRTCTKVIIPVKSLYAWLVTTSKSPTGIAAYDDWTRAGEITITVETKVDTEWRLNLTSNTTLTNKAVLTDNKCLPEGGVSASATVTIPSTHLIDKSMAGKENPAYVEYALNINANGNNLIPGTGDSLEIVDIMGSGMSLSTAHSNYFKVYDVTNVSDLLDSSGNVIVSQAKKGDDVTDQCTVTDITGQYIEGMTDDEVGKPTYLITVPDSRHLVVVYWAIFEGSDGEDVQVTNRVSFFYNNALQSGSGDKTSDQVAAAESSSSLFVGPFFYIRKTDQWGKKLVAGVTYTLYEVTMNTDGTESGRTAIMTKTTDGEEELYFGHRTSDGNSVPQLYKDRLYCLVEEDAPTGYTIDSTPYYFEFRDKGSDTVTYPSGVVLHQFITGGTYSFTNQFESATYSIPVQKTINGKTTVASTTEFSFTLKQKSGDTTPAYLDTTCQTVIPTSGITATIAGSGETLFDGLYFEKEGTYTFLLTENALSNEATKMGYSGDDNTFTVTITVVCGSNHDLVVESAVFTSAKSSVSGGDLSTSVPTFNNKSTMKGTITLTAKKVVTNRTLPVQAGEFGFTVSVDGEVIAETNEDGTTKIGEDGKPVKKVFYTQQGGNIQINLDIDQDDVGTKTYIISEVQGSDSTIKYTTDRVRVKVTIAEDGKGGVVATKYEYVDDVSTFTNEYKATGSITLQGTKVLKNEKTGTTSTVHKGDFNFIVMEGDTQVATGTTENGGSITFTEITYDASDIGVHTYVISEKDEGKDYITYTDHTVTVRVTVTDAGNGTLATSVQYVQQTAGDSFDENGHALFTNLTSKTLIVATGVQLDVLPYVLLFGVAGSLAILALAVGTSRRRKKNGSSNS